MRRAATLSSYRPLNQLRPGSFSLGVPPPQSSFAQISRGHLSMAAYLPRVSSLIAASLERVHFSRRMPGLRYIPSSGFHSLSTVSSALRLHGLVPSRSHVQGCRRSGASLPAQQSCFISSPCPRAVVIPSTHRTLPCGSLSRSACRRMPHPWMPRLRGLSPREAALRTVWG